MANNSVEPCGLLIVRYKDHYYIEPIYHLAYPFSCDWIVADIPSSYGACYEQWLTKKKAHYEWVADIYKERIHEVMTKRRFASGNLKILFVRLNKYISQNAFRLRHARLPQLLTLPSSRLPHPAETVEWTYTIDLDLELFSVNNHLHFRLFAIPRNWRLLAEELQQLEDGYPTTANLREYFLGVENPAHGLVALSRDFNNPSLPPVLTRGILQWSLVNPRPLNAFPIGKRYQARFASRLYRSMTNTSIKQIHTRWNYMSLQSCNKPAPREAIFAILCFASTDPDYCQFAYFDNDNNLKTDEEIDVGRIDSGPEVDSDSEEDSGPEKERTSELISRLGSDSRCGSKSAYIAPESAIYWFNNTLVCLWDRLEHDSEAQTSIKYVVEVATSQGIDCFYAIIISITHVILLQMLPGRHLRRTMRLSLVDLDPKISDEPVIVTNSALCGSRVTPPATDYSAFAAIAHLLEAAQRQTLSLQFSKPQLPLELLLKIVDYSDRQTRNNLAKSSRILRDASQRYSTFADSADIVDTGKWCFLPRESESAVLYLQYGPLPLGIAEEKGGLDPDDTVRVPIIGHHSRTRSFVPEAAFIFEIIPLPRPKNLEVA